MPVHGPLTPAQAAPMALRRWSCLVRRLHQCYTHTILARTMPARAIRGRRWHGKQCCHIQTVDRKAPGDRVSLSWTACQHARVRTTRGGSTLGVLGIESWRMHGCRAARESTRTRRGLRTTTVPSTSLAMLAPKRSLRIGTLFCRERHVASGRRDAWMMRRRWRLVCTCVQQTRSARRRSAATKAEVYEGT